MLTDNTQAVDTRWFQNRLSDIRLSQRKLASLLSLDPAAVSLMLRGKRKMSGAEAAEIAKLLNVSVDEVLLRAGATLPAPERPRAAVNTVVALKDMDVATAPPVAATPALGVLELPVPMSDGSVARLVLPRAMTKQDAERISAVVQALTL